LGKKSENTGRDKPTGYPVNGYNLYSFQTARNNYLNFLSRLKWPKTKRVVMLFGPEIYENPESRSQNPGGKALKSVILAPDSWLLNSYRWKQAPCSLNKDIISMRYGNPESWIIILPVDRAFHGNRDDSGTKTTKRLYNPKK
jgi:hypothetical protein